MRRMFLSLFVFVSVLVISCRMGAEVEEPLIKIGLNADMSSGSAESGEAIKRGAIIAIDEINEKGGLLGGHRLTLIIKDHHGVPARGIANVKSLVCEEGVVAVVGGLHTPVILSELPTIHELGVIYLDPWAAGTPIINNGYNPNYVFRVSVRDEYAGGFIIQHIIKNGHRKIGLLLERTGWGRSNYNALTKALSQNGLVPVALEWFNWGDTEMTPQIKRIRQSGATAFVLVANAPEGALAVKCLARFPEKERIPVFSHWGITGGEFPQIVKEDLKKVHLEFLQTYSFIGAKGLKSEYVIQKYKEKFGAKSARDIFSPVGTAHAYDLIHLLARAIEKAASTERSKVRQALEGLGRYEGLVRTYAPPFTTTKHDALDQTDFQMAFYDSEGVIVPIPIKE